MMMLDARAKIMRIEGQHAFVQADHRNECGECNGKGCGTGKLSQLFCGKPREFRVDNPINAGVGDEVVISVAEGAVLRGISLVYVLPLLLMVMGAILGGGWVEQPQQRDGCAALGALFGLAAGFVIVRWISLRHATSRLQPFIARPWRDG